MEVFELYEKETGDKAEDKKRSSTYTPRYVHWLEDLIQPTLDKMAKDRKVEDCLFDYKIKCKKIGQCYGCEHGPDPL